MGLRQQSFGIGYEVIGIKSHQSLPKRSVQSYRKFLTLDVAEVGVSTLQEVGGLHRVVYLAPSPPRTCLCKLGSIHVVITDIQILIEHTIACHQFQVIEPIGIFDETLFGKTPSQRKRRRKPYPVAFGQFGGMNRCHAEIGVILTGIVIIELQTQVGIASAMVGTRIGLLAALSQQQCIHMMIVGKSVLIAELCREINGLIRRTARYVLRTGMLVHIVLSQ